MASITQLRIFFIFQSSADMFSELTLANDSFRDNMTALNLMFSRQKCDFKINLISCDKQNISICVPVLRDLINPL